MCAVSECGYDKNNKDVKNLLDLQKLNCTQLDSHHNISTGEQLETKTAAFYHPTIAFFVVFSHKKP